MSAPFDTHFGLMQRSPHLIEMFRPNQTEVTGYQLWGHSTIDAAYGDPLDSGVGGAGAASMFTVNRGAFFRSNTLRRKGLGMYESNRRGQTTVVFDVDDFTTPGAGQAMPKDEEWLYLRTQEQRQTPGLLAYPGIPQAVVTLAAVGAGDQLVIKGLIFEFAVGVNALGGTDGQPGTEFIVGLGADDNAAAANLVLALNDAADVGANLDLEAVLNLHTFAPAAVGAVVTIQPEDGTPALVPGSLGAFTITTPDAPRIAIDAAALAAGALVATLDATTPVLGPIYCVPPAITLGMASPAVSFQGTAPSSVVGTPAAGAPAPFSEDITLAGPRPMVLVFPRPLNAGTIHNLSGNDLLLSYGFGQPMINVATATEVSLFSGNTKMIIVACPDVGGAAFRVNAVVGLG